MALIFGHIGCSSSAPSTGTSSYCQSPLDPSPPFISSTRVNGFLFGTMSVNQETPTALFNGLTQWALQEDVQDN